jgi:hypothetical protein
VPPVNPGARAGARLLTTDDERCHKRPALHAKFDAAIEPSYRGGLMVRLGGGDSAHHVRPLSALLPGSYGSEPFAHPQSVRQVTASAHKMNAATSGRFAYKFDAAIRPSCAGLVVRPDGGESHTSSGRSRYSRHARLMAKGEPIPDSTREGGFGQARTSPPPAIFGLS